jgi:hypothetical protein
MFNVLEKEEPERLEEIIYVLRLWRPQCWSCERTNGARFGVLNVNGMEMVSLSNTIIADIDTPRTRDMIMKFYYCLVQIDFI